MCDLSSQLDRMYDLSVNSIACVIFQVNDSACAIFQFNDISCIAFQKHRYGFPKALHPNHQHLAGIHELFHIFFNYLIKTFSLDIRLPSSEDPYLVTSIFSMMHPAWYELLIKIIIIVYFPKNYRLMHMLHTRKSYINIVYKCNRRDGCQRNRKFIIAGRHSIAFYKAKV